MNKKGFSLIELLIVIVIIGIIAVIAIPSLLESKKAAMSGAAVQMLRNISSAEVAYSIKPPKCYGLLTDLSSGGNLDSRFSASPALIDGYNFTGVAGINTFTVTAAPADDNTLPSYYVNQSGTVFYGGGTNPVN